jgi:phosphoglycolate phosphatase-like HAD superfamily hydrolase
MLDLAAVDALLFDLDGTLLDSDDQAVEGLARRLARLGFRRPQLRARRLVMAAETPINGLLTALDMVGIDEPVGWLADRLHRWRGQRKPADFRIVAGVDRALAFLSAEYRMGVVTTRGRGEAMAFLEQYGLRSLFEVVVTRESTWRLKPHPAPVLHAARALAVPPTRCAMVGDTTVDIKSARRAGAFAVAVLCGFGERDELERAGAHLVLSSPVDLPAALGFGEERSDGSG